MKQKFVTMCGIEVEISKKLLDQALVEKSAEKHYKQKVMCEPGFYGTGVVFVGWQIKNRQTGEIIGYMPLTTGVFSDYPDDFEYGVTTFIPLGSARAKISKYFLRYVDNRIEITDFS